MQVKSLLKNASGLMVVMLFTACHGVGIEGSWVDGSEWMSMYQGIKLEAGGKASSVNMATLQYESWTNEGGQLILTGKASGTARFCLFRYVDNREADTRQPGFEERKSCDKILQNRGMKNTFNKNMKRIP